LQKKKPIYVTLKQQVVWLITNAFGIAAALFWKDAIQRAINTYIPAEQGLAYTIYAAIIMTLVAIIAVWIVHEIFE
jgi:membrane protein YdbS with pleckstrin-like domain